MVEKIEIAIEQLETAVELFRAPKPKFVAALTLAGAAEEILGRMVANAGKVVALYGLDKVYPMRPAVEEIAETAVAIARLYNTESDVTVKRMRDRANAPRNKAKHHDDGAPWGWNGKDEAAAMIDRAFDNYWKLMQVGHAPPEPAWMEAYRISRQPRDIYGRPMPDHSTRASRT